MHLHRVASQFYNRPLLLLPSQAETISAFLLSRMSAGGFGADSENDSGESYQLFASSPRSDGGFEVHTPRASRFYGDYPIDPDSNGRPKPYRRTADGTAIITMVGELVNRGAYVGASSGLISYEGFKYQSRIAAADPRTRNVILDMQTPGGEAVGAFEAAQATRELNAVKPVVAVVDGMAASAGYAIASAASRIVTIPTGLTGSIGVVMMHLDFSAWLKDQGIKPTLIFAGDHKVDGNPYEPLPNAVRGDFQREVESFYDQFVATVAQGRAQMTDKQIRGTQARVFKGEDAVRVGLADAVGTFEEVLAELSQPAQTRAQPKGTTMSQTDTAPAAAAGISQADHSAAVTTARTEGAAEAGQAAKTRVKAILGSEQAKGRAALAEHFAFDTDMSAEAALAALDKAPKASATPSIAERAAAANSTLALGAPLDAAKTAATIDLSEVYAARRKACR